MGLVFDHGKAWRCRLCSIESITLRDYGAIQAMLWNIQVFSGRENLIATGWGLIPGVGPGLPLP
jgi:hypothetical protein